MTKKLRFDGVEHDISALSRHGRKQVAMIRFVDQRLEESTKMLALLDQTRRNCLDTLEREIIQARSGVDIAHLLSE